MLAVTLCIHTNEQTVIKNLFSSLLYNFLRYYNMGCGGSKENSTVAQKPEPISEPQTTDTTPKVLDFKPIHSAIRWNKPLNEIEKLLDSIEAVNAEDANNGNRPIHIAAQNGHFETVQLLVKLGADLNVQNAKGNTPIHMAVGYDYYETAMLLIEAKADPEMKNAAGFAGKNGIDGDKCLGLAALVSAKTSEDTDFALELCEEQVDQLIKSSFAAAGMKTKKNLGSSWTSEHQDRFKNLLLKLN